MGRSALATLSVFLLTAAGAGAETLVVDFSGPAGSDYTVTVLDDVLSSLSAGPANGRFEITGSVVAGSEPKVLLEPNATVLAGDTWSVEARFEVSHTLLGSLAVQDSLQTWISIGNVFDDDDDARAKSGILKGPFDVGGMMVQDGYFVSSGFVFDDDDTSGTGNPTEYSIVDPAAAGPGSTVTTTLRVEYDPIAGELTTLYRIGAGPFVPYPLEDGGMPAPVVDPQSQWMAGPTDELDVFLLFSATRAATGPGESGDITSSFSLSSGDVWFDDLVVTAVPEPGLATGGATALLCLALLTVHLRREGGPSRRTPQEKADRPRWRG